MNATIERLERQIKEERYKIDLLGECRELLGVELTPTISNVSERGEVRAWLSFSAPAYDPDRKHCPVKVFRALERDGFEIMPATLCRYGSWRPGVYPGGQHEVKDQNGRDELKYCWPIAPVWVVPCQHTNPDFQCFMRKGGQTFRVSVDLDRSLVGLSAKSVKYFGGWRLERGTGRLRFPDRWYGLEHATVHQNSRCWVDTEQGMSGAVYFMPHGDQDEWPLSASEFVAELLEAKP